MTTYAAPIADMRFTLDRLCGLAQIARLPGYEEATPDLVGQVLEGAGKLAAEVLAPLNQPGDRQGSVLENGVVRTPDGFPAAYRAYADGGWNGLPFAPEHGGMGLPWVLATAVQEMWQSSNMAFALCPLLTVSAIEALAVHGTEAQKALYLPKLVTGAWTGTMALTEPQSGSDLGLMKTRAVRDGDHYRLSGQKIFITYGDQDFTDNIIHMVLARLPDAPPGTRGISLFLVPKFLVNADGTLGPRNDVRCVSLEHKLGIHASPTAVMAFGDNDGAVGYLVGAENAGLKCMFTMMNVARLAAGLQGVAIAERATQQAVAYARGRVQSDALGGQAGAPVTIIRHPDVRRMLMTMRAATEAMRALTYTATAALDVARRHPDDAARAAGQVRVDLLTPVVKAWCTDMAVEVASLGIQVHGGMGYIEETGAAQHLRDARITPIYEGTNGIQANDLVGRKLLRDGGAGMAVLIDEIAALAPQLAGETGLAGVGEALADGLARLREATAWLLAHGPSEPALAFAGAAPYLQLVGTVGGGWLSARAALAARQHANGDADFATAKAITARFYAAHILPRAKGLRDAVIGGAAATMALDEALF